MSNYPPSLEATHSVDSPDRIVYGFGATEHLGKFADENDVESVLLITDSNITDLGVTDTVQSTLRKADVDVAVFDEITSEPKLPVVEKAASTIRECDYNLIVGIGGGSCLDTAKFAAVLAEADGPAQDMFGMGNVPGSGRATVLVPTTAGTGSEVTHIGVFADPNRGDAKRVVYSKYLFADLAIVDPELTRTVPSHVAAATGLDALTHAIESYVSVLRTPYSDMLARRAMELIGDNLRSAVHQGEHNHRSRYAMSLASMLAGQAFVNSGLGAIHALTYPIGMRYDVGHGRANAMLLPHVLEYNVPAEPSRFAEIGEFLGVEDSGTAIERASATVDAVFDLVGDVGIPTSIGHLGDIDEEELETFTDVAFEYSQHNIDRNPRSLDRDDVLEIYRNAC